MEKKKKEKQEKKRNKLNKKSPWEKKEETRVHTRIEWALSSGFIKNIYIPINSLLFK